MNFFHTTPYLIYTLDVVIQDEKPDEDDLIDHILHNQPPTSMPIPNLMKEFRSSRWIDL